MKQSISTPVAVGIVVVVVLVVGFFFWQRYMAAPNVDTNATSIGGAAPSGRSAHTRNFQVTPPGGAPTR
jgi:hypothetical protein